MKDRFLLSVTATPEDHRSAEQFHLAVLGAEVVTARSIHFGAGRRSKRLLAPSQHAKRQSFEPGEIASKIQK